MSNRAMSSIHVTIIDGTGRTHLQSICKRDGKVYSRVNEYKENLRRIGEISKEGIEGLAVTIRNEIDVAFESYCTWVQTSNRLFWKDWMKEERGQDDHLREEASKNVDEFKKMIGDLYDQYLAAAELLFEQGIKIETEIWDPKLSPIVEEYTTDILFEN